MEQAGAFVTTERLNVNCETQAVKDLVDASGTNATVVVDASKF